MQPEMKSHVRPLEPYAPSPILRAAIDSVRDEMEALRMHVKTLQAKLQAEQRKTEVLTFLLHDEFMSNGGHFQSTEADCVFRQQFSTDIEDTNMSIFTRLMSNKNGIQ